ncbi:L-asparaginase 1-like isoform X2 [Hoplias malabaricus]|uniref:L-asparaginase 1-like isoform X2 n=1 Tax=Hoplias malabaricus TaxID=27720 RepID=UPI003461E174
MADPIIRKVYVLYTGGTFGMKKNKDGRLIPQDLETLKDFIINHTILYVRNPGESEDFVRKRIVTKDGFITLYHQLADDDPETKGKLHKILYKMEALEPPIDSSSITPEHWRQMAEKIKDNKHDFDGFVIIHGTDTMAFTSSALSFILWDIKKTVIVTGSQMPIFHPRTDGIDNFVGSMLMAGYFSNREEMQQVMLYDLNKLYMGNRVVKCDCDSFSVFDSPDVYPLASLETTIKLISAKISLKKAQPKDSLSVKRMFTKKENPQVRILRFFPGITEEYVSGVLNGAAGVILETYGNGNVPEFEWLKTLLLKADKNVLMLNCTQVYRGTVLPIYQASEILTKANVISGYDITPEAALTKMIWTLKSYNNTETIRKILEHSVCGESCAPPISLIMEQ